MILGFALITLGYAVMYWGIHHFPGADCPKSKDDPNGTHCRYSLVQVLGLDMFGIGSGSPVVYNA